MATPLCTATEVAETLGVEPFVGLDLAQVVRLSAQVSGLIRWHCPRVDAWVLDGRLDVDVVSGLACQLVARLRTTIRAGGGALRSETHPEYGYTLSPSVLSGLKLSAAELELLTPADEDRSAFTIRPSACR